ncbi:MAG: pentapeptide repeat-containing protein [Legionella sp.]
MTQLFRPIVGLIQGIIIYYFLYCNQLSDEIKLAGLVITSFPLFALQLKLPNKNNWLLAITLLIPMAIAYSYAALYLLTVTAILDNYVATLLAGQCVISAFIVTIFYCVSMDDHQYSPSSVYAMLFHQTWEIILKIVLGSLLLSFFWGLSALAALLFEILDITFISRIISSKEFYSITPTVVFGMGMSILNEKEFILYRFRQIILAFCKLAYPIYVIITTSFLLLFPFSSQTLADFWPLIILLNIVNIILFNNIFQEGLNQQPYRPWFANIICLCLLLSGGYSLYILKFAKYQLLDHDLTPSHLLIAIALALNALYGLGYIVAIFINNKPWMNLVKSINISLAILIACLYLGLSLPWLNIVTLTAHYNFRHLLNQQTLAIQTPSQVSTYFVGIDMRGSHLTGRYLRLANLSHSNLEHANLTKTDLYGAQLKSSNLSHAILTATNFDMAQLENTNLTGAIVTNASFNNCWFNQAILDHVEFYDVDLTTAVGLQQSELDKACGNNVKLPENLHISSCKTQ